MPAWPRWCRILPAEAPERRAYPAGGRALGRRGGGSVHRPLRPDGHRWCASCRRAARRSCRRWGRIRLTCWPSRFLADTARALEARGAMRISAPFPLGASKAPPPGCAPPPSASGVAPQVSTVARPGQPRAGPAGDGPEPRAARGQAHLSSSPIRQLEIPLARFLSAANWACSWSRSARPTCTASIWPRSWRCCRPARR